MKPETSVPIYHNNDIISQWGWRWQANGYLCQIKLKASKHKTNPMQDMWKTIFWTALDEFPDSDSYGLAQKLLKCFPIDGKGNTLFWHSVCTMFSVFQQCPVMFLHTKSWTIIPVSSHKDLKIFYVCFTKNRQTRSCLAQTRLIFATLN